MSYSVEDTGDAIVVANPLPWSTRLLEILLRLALISLLMDTAWKKLTLDPETYISLVPYLSEPLYAYMFAALTLAIVIVFIARTLTEGPETWTFNDEGIAHARKSFTGTHRRQWGEDGLAKVVYRTRRLDGPDLFRLELFLKRGPRLTLVWMKSRSDRDAIGHRLQEMFPTAAVKLDSP